MPTPSEIMRGLNEYVIGQRNVKVALSVGVYNHYKRIFVAETTQNATTDKIEKQQQQQRNGTTNDTMMMDNGPTSLSHLKLGQFGNSIIPPQTPPYYMDSNKINENLKTNTSSSSAAFCEAPGADDLQNRIDSSSSTGINFGRDVEDCEIEKSNIMLLGPTGSGKVCFKKIYIIFFIQLLGYFPKDTTIVKL